MKWQKGRVPEFGVTVWLKAEPPVVEAALDFDTRTVLEPVARYTTNIRDDEEGCLMTWPADKLELLPEFAEDVPIQRWSEWWSGWVKTKGS